jgi:quercetin dioxygenase-like cupin family protein
MPTIPRRVVTGHDARGRSVFASDDPVPAAGAAPSGTLFYELWATDATPAPISAGPGDAGPGDAGPGADDADTAGAGVSGRAARPLSVTPAPNGTTLRINELPPGAGSPMHRTQTVDYAIVLDGEVVLVVEGGETVLRAGDVVVQRGTSHRWENRSAATARVAFILIDGAFTAELLATLGSAAPGGLFHDPLPAPGATGAPGLGSATKPTA